MVSGGKQISHHQCLPEEVAQEIFDSVYKSLLLVSGDNFTSDDCFMQADLTSRGIQQTVANHCSDLMWKMINRRPCSFAPATPVAGEYVEVRPGRFDHLIKG